MRQEGFSASARHCYYPQFTDKVTKALKGHSRSHSELVAEPGFKPGNLAPEFIWGDGSREVSRVAHHWELDGDSLRCVGSHHCKVGAELSGTEKTRHRAVSWLEVLQQTATLRLR